VDWLPVIFGLLLVVTLLLAWLLGKMYAFHGDYRRDVQPILRGSVARALGSL
jgi:hypothetical protein